MYIYTPSIFIVAKQTKCVFMCLFIQIIEWFFVFEIFKYSDTYSIFTKEVKNMPSFESLKENTVISWKWMYIGILQHCTFPFHRSLRICKTGFMKTFLTNIFTTREDFLWGNFMRIRVCFSTDIQKKAEKDSIISLL